MYRLDFRTHAQRERLIAQLQSLGESSMHHARSELHTPQAAGRIRESRRAEHRIITLKQLINTGLGWHRMTVYRLIGGSHV